MEKSRLKEIFQSISPILISPKSSSLTLSFSKRFFLFQLFNKISGKIENDPFLNFIAVLKNYKILGRFLHGTIKELYRDRNKFYFKKFFMNDELYESVKSDLEWVYNKNSDMNLTITKRGIIIYDNYKKDSFNVLLLTIHSGTCMPKDIQAKQAITKSKRLLEEDINTHKIYGNLVLEKGGIWVDNKFSRFACDYNRSPENAIYKNNPNKKSQNYWKEEITHSQRKSLMEGYVEFYFMLGHLIETHRFNIIFDGHSMKNMKNRPSISFGTRYIPIFYMPIVKSMQRKLITLGYNSVSLNKPFEGGYILKWMNNRFPDIFIFSMEVNKKLYMSRNRRRTIIKKLKKLSENITHIFDIEESEQ